MGKRFVLLNTCWRTYEGGLPTSALDLPPEAEGKYGGHHEDGDYEAPERFKTREAALAEAAEYNAERFQEWDRARQFYGSWLVVAEIGKGESGEFAYQIDTVTGTGKVTHEREWPLRLVRPTTEELERHQLTDEPVCEVVVTWKDGTEEVIATGKTWNQSNARASGFQAGIGDDATVKVRKMELAHA